MRHLPVALTVVTILWPASLGAALVDRTQPQPGLLAAVVYFAASHVCHQRPERSFHTQGRPWPVCGRCSGLYVAAPIGALVAMFRRKKPVRAWTLLTVAVLPTIATVVFELVNPAAATSAQRFVAAIPLGAVLTYLVVTTSAGAAESIG